MQLHLSLGRFSLIDGLWVPPPGTRGVVDLVPPQLDAETDVNYALFATDERVDSEQELLYLGYGDPRELQLSNGQRDEWQSITGYQPGDVSVATAVGHHLTLGSRAAGDTRAKPLIPAGRTIAVHLAGEIIWQHELSGMSDTLYPFVLAGELQSLREIYADAGEPAYRKALWVLERRRALSRPAAEYLPSNDPLLPHLTSLEPQTTKLIETWGTAGTKSADYVDENGDTWFINSAGSQVTVDGGKIYCIAQRKAQRLEYAFGGSDLDAVLTVGNWAPTTDRRIGPVLRHTGAYTSDSWYSAWYHYSAGQLQIVKCISGTITALSSFSLASIAAGHAVRGSVTGTTLKCYHNGTERISQVDTALSSGTKAGWLTYSGHASEASVESLSLSDGVGGVVVPSRAACQLANSLTV